MEAVSLLDEAPTNKREAIRLKTVADLMTFDPQSVTPAATLRQVMEKLMAEGCRQLPVIDSDGRLVGIITDRDVRLALNSPMLLHERSEDEKMLNTVTAEALMTPDPIAVDPETPAAVAANMLSTYKFGALPVLAGDKVVGIITVTDFLDWFAELNDFDQIVEAELEE